ncbi:hypothetical protein NDR87_07690 [Nocardia sp. CDC159]|uniref:Uncharacterized protein n=1 Tax=Nocardia pulmonis TaxID=2951408 RepID=A0A9X2IX10_9NOCA|nr:MULTISPECIES: hypothetical protein [Nocardia]MCM6773350.1 hypothetical protein [Nocardia pulmonis]MCM6786237.1 hypothetical protein [Nocardia sp. CDC159]
MAVTLSLVRLAAVVAGAAVLTGAWTGPTAAAEPDPAAAIARADRASVSPDVFADYDDSMQRLQRLGLQPFLWPSISPMCSDFDPDYGGIAPAVAGAIPGPWPKHTIAIPGLELSGVKAGQTLFAFVPFGLWPDGPDTSGMQLAWLNVSTGKSGFVPMGPLSDLVRVLVPPEVPASARPLAELIVRNLITRMLPFGGVRVAPVDTGSGTVLAVMFGTVRNGVKTCFFLPTVGIVSVP